MLISLNVVIHLYRSMHLVFIRNLESNRLALLIMCCIEMEFRIVGTECAIVETAHPRWDIVENRSYIFLALIHLIFISL